MPTIQPLEKSGSKETMTPSQLAKTIDHTKLAFKPGEVENETIVKLCLEAKEYGFYSVCVRPEWIQLAKETLVGTDVKVATVIGFPKEAITPEQEQVNPTIGNFSTEVKLSETKFSLAQGADELDIVLNVGCFKKEFKVNPSLQPETLQELTVLQNASEGRPVKLIIETDLLSDEEITQATRLCAKANVAMVKTCTGFIQGGRGATLPVIQRIADTLRSVNKNLGIKASGGVRTTEQALNLLKTGATRIGASAGIELIKGLNV